MDNYNNITPPVYKNEKPNEKSVFSGYTGDGNVFTEKINTEQIRKALSVLKKYQNGKKSLEKRITENEKWYRLRHWECLADDSDKIKPVSAWLFNSLENKHADAMDNYPSPNILPREEADIAEAKRLTDIIPVTLEMNDFEKVYSDVWRYKLRSGTGVYGVYWDGKKLNGLGDIVIKKIDLLNLFWEPGITDIQNSKNVFCVELVDNDLLISEYPFLRGKLGSNTGITAKYYTDDTIDTSDKSSVIDWYYKKYVNGRCVLHYCKFVNDTLLFATENEPMYAQRGWYDHGLYPFVFDPLFTVEGSPCGFGYIDVGKSSQEYIDRGNQAVLTNMLSNATARYFVRNDGSVNEKDLLDVTKPVVPVNGSLNDENIKLIDSGSLSGVYITVLNNKIDELKETTGNRDISTGGTTSGVTAASAIAALQEAGSKLSRDMIKGSYRAYRLVILQVIELIRQFYGMSRTFRIMGEGGSAEYISYTNENISPKPQGFAFGCDMGFGMPLFDVEVSAQKDSPYTKLSQNELALQLYNLGFFSPQNATQALACLGMMDFKTKQNTVDIIKKNGDMLKEMLSVAEIADSATGGKTNYTEIISEKYGLPVNKSRKTKKSVVLSDDKESPVTYKARQRVANSTAPR